MRLRSVWAAALTSDRARPALALACAAALVAMGLYYAHVMTTSRDNLSHCVAHREDCRDRALRLPLWHVTAVRADGYDVRKAIGPIAVDGDPSGLAVADTVSLIAVFDADAASPRLIETWRKKHPLRPYKVLLGLAGTILAGAILVATIRVRRRRLRLELRA